MTVKAYTPLTGVPEKPEDLNRYVLNEFLQLQALSRRIQTELTRLDDLIMPVNVGSWFVIGDSLTTPNGEANPWGRQYGGVLSWVYLLERRERLTPSVEAANGRGVYFNGYAPGGGTGATWDLSNAPPAEDFPNVLIHLGTNDGNGNADETQYKTAYQQLLNDLVILGWLRQRIFCVLPPEPNLWPLTDVRRWTSDLVFQPWDIEKTNTPDGVHMDQEGQDQHADDIYAHMLGVTIPTEYIRTEDARSTFVRAGYGGIQLVTPIPVSLAIPEVGFTTLTADAISIDPPKDTTQDPANGAMGITTEGVWMANISFSLTFDEAQQGRSFTMQLRNTTTDNVPKSSKIAIGRNTDGANISVSFLAEISEAQENNTFAVEIGEASASFTNAELIAYEYSLNRVGEYRD